MIDISIRSMRGEYFEKKHPNEDVFLDEIQGTLYLFVKRQDDPKKELEVVINELKRIFENTPVRTKEIL